MGLLANPWTILAIVLFYLGSLAGAGWKGYHLGEEHVIAAQAKEQADIKKGQDEALQAAATAIAKIDVRNVTIRQKAESIIREVPVYRDCVQPADGLQLVNEALAPPDAGAGSVHPGKLP